MKIHRVFPVVVLLALMSLVLSGCGGTLFNTWPGISAQGNVVYLANQGTIHAINADTGVQVWQYPTEKPDNSKPFFSPPTVTKDMIVAGNYGHQIVALDLDGKAKWTTPFDPGSGHFVASPLVVKDTIIAPSSNNQLYALDLTGKQLWSFESKNMLWATPASDGTLVYVPALDHNLYALNLSDGKQVWAKDLGSALQSAPVLTEDGNLYVATMGGEIVALKAQDGSITWRKTVASGHLWSTPLLNGDTLYTGSDSGEITAFSAKDGSVIWHQSAGSPIIGGGALLKDGVAFVTEGGSVAGWSLDGKTKLSYPTVNGKLYSTPVVAGQNLVIALTEGKDSQVLQAFNANGGSAWTFPPPAK